MRNILLIIVSLFFLRTAYGQDAPSVEISAPFKTADCYRSKVFLCANGNTFLFNFKAAGCEYFLFGKDRKLIKRGGLTGKMASCSGANQSVIPLMYELDGNIVCFIQQQIDRRPAVSRALISTVDATTSKDTQLAILARHGAMSAFATELGGVANRVEVARNREAGGYAVIREDGLQDDVANGLIVDLYNRKHEKTGTYAYKKLTADAKYQHYIDADFKGNDLLLCTHEFTTRSKGVEQSHLVLTRISPDGQVKQQKNLPLEVANKDFETNIRYLPKADRLMVLYMEPDGHYKGGPFRYVINMTALKGTDFEKIYSQPVEMAQVENVKAGVCQSSKTFKGSVFSWFPNERGGMSIVLSEREIQTQSSERSNSILGPRVSSSQSYRDAGVIKYDENGKPYEAVYHPFFIDAAGPAMPIAGEEYSRPIACGGSGKSMYLDWSISAEAWLCNYIHTPEHDYFIRNYPHNSFDDEPCSSISVLTAWKTSAALYTVSPKDARRDFLWAKAQEKDDYHAIMTGASDYDARTQTFGTVLLEANGKEMILHLGWIHLP